MKRPSVIASGGFSESEISHSTGIRAKINTKTMPMLHSAYSRVPRSIVYLPGRPSSTRTPKPLT